LTTALALFDASLEVLTTLVCFRLFRRAAGPAVALAAAGFIPLLTPTGTGLRVIR
jgi:hypothetical protein